MKIAMPDSANETVQNPENKTTDYDVVIVGAGFGGLYSLHRLREHDLTAIAFEAGDDVGGTWYWNKYPGARCDVESLEYSYSFSDDLQQDWNWSERYGTQPEILRYAGHVADRFDLRRDIRFKTRVTSASFNEQTNIWTVETDKGDRVTAKFCIMATGNLSTPNVPDFKGVETFQGKWYHSGLWPAEGVDFTGLRVGVIGTGSSGVQMIPHIAEQAKHLHVFQRTANFILPAENAPMDPQRLKKHKAHYPERRADAQHTPFAIGGFPPPTQSALEVSEADRNAAYESKWRDGGSISFLYTYKDLLVNQEANDTASEFVRDKIRNLVDDPETAALLCPNDHPIGTKRLILDTGYFETYNRDNVTLVNVRAAPIEEITPTGIRTTDSEYEFDALIFATGFDAMTGAMKEINIKTSAGLTIQDKWEDGPRTYLGLIIAGFPNMFVITGPGSPSVKANMITAIEQHTNWIVDCLVHLRTNDLNRVEATPDAETNWVQHVNDVADTTLYPKANSWYVGANIPGKPRIFMPYVGGYERYKKICDDVAAKNYEGLTMTRQKTVV
ncbi:MAG: cyclohexanone monooxygenase [Alphaproteobacteria bacterium]|jgi:cyclohexanone monooxygenase